MLSLKDNIVALATAPGRAAINIVRVSGSKSLKFLFCKLTNNKKLPLPNSAYPYLIYSNDKEVIDQSVIIYFKAPKSFTGENMLEISVHGGDVIANNIIKTLLGLGCRMAGPGEFTYRAFINNKINLVQAESINSIINSENEQSSNKHVENLTGGLSAVLSGAQEEVKNMLILAEHEIDFSEEEVSLTKKGEYLGRLTTISKSISFAVENSCYEEFKEEPRIVIVGKPNVGKSSLFNKIVGYDRSIVTNIKGTTRDFIEAKINLRGKKIILVDTAGIRETKTKIEKMGIKKTKEELEKGYVFIVVDEKNPAALISKIKKRYPSALLLSVINKIDKNSPAGLTEADYKISCTKNIGLDDLLTGLSTHIETYYINKYQKREYLINERQSVLLSSINTKINSLISEYTQHADLVLFASSLRGVLDEFNRLIRPIDQNEILNEIFQGFCVGK